MHILKDQAAIWGSPAHIRVADLNWLVPLAGITAGAIVTDHDSIAHVVPVDTQLNHRSVQASNGMLGAIIAVPVVNAAIGAFGDHPRAREAAILSTEAAVDSAVVEQGMKLMFWRERPGVDNANGKFWQRSAGTDSSFPSSHSVFAWSLAAIIAGEYPSRFTKVAIYGLATGVSATRVAGRDHFPADVLVGSAAGWLIGHYIVRKRHHWDDDYDTP